MARFRAMVQRVQRVCHEMGPAGRSSPKTYQTRRAWASFVRATEATRHGTGAWTWLHAPRAETAREFWRNRSSLVPTLRVGMPSSTLPRRPPIPGSTIGCNSNQRLDPRITRSHAPRGNALFDALRRLRSPDHQSVVTATNDSIRASLVPTLRVGMPSLTLCVASDPQVTSLL